jgi:hypothetical protein
MNHGRGVGVEFFGADRLTAFEKVAQARQFVILGIVEAVTDRRGPCRGQVAKGRPTFARLRRVGPFGHGRSQE